MVPLEDVNASMVASDLPVLDAGEYACTLTASGLSGFDLDELLRREPKYRDVVTARQFASAHVGCIDHLKVLDSAPSKDALQACADTFPPAVAVEAYLAAYISDSMRLARTIYATASCMQDVSLLASPGGPLVLYLRARSLEYVLDQDILSCATMLVPATSGPLPETIETASAVAVALSQCLSKDSLAALMAVSAKAEEVCVAQLLGSSTDLARQVLDAYLRDDNTSGLAFLESIKTSCPLDPSVQPDPVPRDQDPSDQ